MASSFGDVTICCPGCARTVSFPVYATLAPPRAGAAVCNLSIDMDAVAAHLLTHGPHDGEPLPAAA